MKGKRFCAIIAVLLLVLAIGIPAARADSSDQHQVSFVAEHDAPTQGLLADQVDEVNTEKFTFQTEISRLMNIIINSLYKNPEIFLRELISNASDALDKIRFLSLTDSSALGANDKLTISIAADPESRTLIITDTGIGMTRDQLKDNLGTIAKSGTSEFLKKLEDNKEDVSLIGQFGVGFYSAFLVADRVTVASKSNDDPDQHVWISEAVDDFVIAKDPRGNTLGRGTQITLHLKKTASEYLAEDRLKELVGRYSEFINFPIYMWSRHNETVVEEKSESDATNDDDVVEEVLDDDESKEKTKETKTVTVHGWELVNTNKPIWMRSPQDVSDKEYLEFYRAFVKDTKAEPLHWTHTKGEGEVEFRSLLYIPSEANPEFFSRLVPDFKSIKLYVKRIFITDETDLFPPWFTFIRGVVDAEDMLLNVSRETLQKQRTLRSIAKHLIKKAIDMFSQLAKTDKEKYAKFYKQFGHALKMGCIQSNTDRRKLAPLLRFYSSHDSASMSVSLDDYVDRMKTNQTSLYYLSGMSVQEVQQSPFLEYLQARGYEVLYFIDVLDEALLDHMPGYNGKVFVNAAKDDLRLGEDDVDEKKSFDPLFKWLRKVLDNVGTVSLSKRLTKSPMAVVAPFNGMTGHRERILEAQNMGDSPQKGMYQMMRMVPKTLEINPRHPIIQTLLNRVEQGDEDEEDEHLVELVKALYETASLRSGYTLGDVAEYSRRIEKLVARGIGADTEEVVVEPVEPVPEKTKEEREEDEAIRAEARSFAEEDEDEEDDREKASDKAHGSTEEPVILSSETDSSLDDDTWPDLNDHDEL